MNDIQTTESPPRLTLRARIAYGGGCGAFVGISAAFLACLPIRMPGGQNAMAAVFLGPVIALLAVICVAGSTVVGIVAAISRLPLVLFLGTLILGVLTLSVVYYDSDPIARSFVPSIAIALVTSGLIGVALRNPAETKYWRPFTSQ
jgi:hypothetical protein